MVLAICTIFPPQAFEVRCWLFSLPDSRRCPLWGRYIHKHGMGGCLSSRLGPGAGRKGARKSILVIFWKQSLRMIEVDAVALTDTWSHVKDIYGRLCTG